jgi:hypothetical protein
MVMTSEPGVFKMDVKLTNIVIYTGSDNSNYVSSKEDSFT